MTELSTVVVIALMGGGLAYLGAKLDGPFGWARLVREWAQNADYAPVWLQTGVGCVFCQAFYWTCIAAWLVLGVGSFSVFLAGWLAGFGLAVFGLLYTGH